MKVDCNGCGTFVDATIKCKFTASDEFSDFIIEYVFLQCPSCDGPILVSREAFHMGYGDINYDSPITLYPKFTKKFETEIPDNVKFNYEEAERCLKIKSYTAMAVMCRRTLESVCDHFECKKDNLYKKLKELEENRIIDNAVYEWAEMLRLEGNSAAHDVSERVSSENARDILDFTHALIEYVFSYKEKFLSFKKRREERDTRKINKTKDNND